MKTTKLEMLWTFIFNLARVSIKKNPEYDGRALWKSIAKVLPDAQATRWILDEKIKTHIFSCVPEVKKQLDNPEEDKIYHFVRQLARLTYKTPTIKHILQIAFSSGNLIGSDDELSHEMISRIGYVFNDLNSIFTYVSREDVKKLSSLM